MKFSTIRRAILGLSILCIPAISSAQSAEEKAKLKEKYSDKELQEMQQNATISKEEALKVRRASDAKNGKSQSTETAPSSASTTTFGGPRKEPLVPKDENARRTLEQVREAREALKNGQKAYTPPPSETSTSAATTKAGKSKKSVDGEKPANSKSSGQSSSASHTARETLTKKLVAENEKVVIARARAMSALKKINADLKAGKITQAEYDSQHSIIKQINQKADEMEQHIRDTRLRLAANT